jgi:phage nucleotide-binding protein
MLKIENTKNVQGQRVKAIIYGESGSGKTTLASTLDGKTLVISAEGGLLSVAGADLDFIDLAVDNEGKTITDPSLRIQRLQEIFKFLHAGTSYKNIFLDSLTEISELMVAALNKEFPDRKDSLVLYGENSKRMRSIVKSFRDLQYNVFMTCISKIDKDDNNRRYYAFSVTGKIGDALPQYFDEVFLMQIDKDGNRGLITKKSDTNLCKDRSKALEPLEVPDLGAVVRKIINNMTVSAKKEGETK